MPTPKNLATKPSALPSSVIPAKPTPAPVPPTAPKPVPPVQPATPKPAVPVPPKPAPTPAPKPTPATVVVVPPEPDTADYYSLKPNQDALTQSKNTSQRTASELALANKCSAMNIPGWLQQSTMPEVIGRDMTGFVGFASSHSQKWDLQQSAGLSEGQPYLHHQNQYIGVDPLEFFLLAGETFQSLMVGKQGKFKWVSRDLEEEGPTDGSNKPEPHYICLLIASVPGYGAIPIKGDFRGTKSRGIESSIRAIEAAATPEWLGLSDAHKITAVFPQPFGRVFHSLSTEYGVSKSNGNPFFVTNCICQPASIAQMQWLLDTFENDDFKKLLREAKMNYDARVAFMDKIATDGPQN